MAEIQNIFPQFDELVQKNEKELLLKQRAQCFWFTGLSGSGKSTYAIALERFLHNKGFAVKLLDGDNVRTGLNNNLGFSISDRKENIRRIAEVNKLFLDAGIICLNSFVSPTLASRKEAQDIIGTNFKEIHVHASFDTCAKRDVKGLYAKALAGEIKNFTGLDSPYEAPKNPFLLLDTEQHTFEEGFTTLSKLILPLVTEQKL